jgi:hypothetical protein
MPAFKGPKKINYRGSLADFKQSGLTATGDASELDGGGGSAVTIMGGGVKPGSYGFDSSDTTFINEQPGQSGRAVGSQPYGPVYPSQPVRPSKPADRYPVPLKPGQLPRRPVDRYPEASPAVPKKPKKPKKSIGGGGGGGSNALGIE